MRRAIWKRLLALGLTVVLLAATLSIPAYAATMDEVKNSLATVDITQTYSYGEAAAKELDAVEHNYRTRGDQVNITYAATLQMTDVMATYLQARQGNLMKASFDIHVNMDMELLEFDTDKDTITMTFTSTFLKPAAKYADGTKSPYTYVLKGYDAATKVFTYEITADKAWAESQKNGFVIPAELIVYAAQDAAYGYEEVKSAFTREELKTMPLMYGKFEVSDWMHEIKLTLTDMDVKDGVAETVTTNRSTWKTVIADGTIEGEFAYIGESAADSIDILLGYEDCGYVTTLKFGDGQEITGWKSNQVKVLLKRTSESTTQPESPYLNNEDHFAYIIGYPEGGVQPAGNITRAEVATIFFRMLNDETRSTYWKTTNSYDDVASTAWYNNAVSTLTNLGVINGMPDGGFHPDDNITRAEFATMAARFFVVSEDYDTTTDAFSDIAGHWARENVNLAYLLGIISGYPDGTYRPQNPISRAEAMTIVNNSLRRSPCNEGLLPVSQMITWPDNMDTSKWYYAAVQEATNSHEYTVDQTTGKETWIKELPVRDWVAFEKTWSDANSAKNPGEVVQ